MDVPFEKFRVMVCDEYSNQVNVCLEQEPTEQSRQFIEDAIREKLERGRTDAERCPVCGSENHIRCSRGRAGRGEKGGVER